MRSRKARRGSTLVLVGIMLVAFVGVGAIAADIGRFYVVTGELQTAADAAALAGAVKLMGTAGSNPESVIDPYVVAWVAATNKADTGSLSVTADSVRMAFWTPGLDTTVQGTLSYALNGRRPNAVTVALAGAPRGMFSKFLGQVAGVSMSRSGTAWVANLGSNCVRPWNFPYLPLWQRVENSTTVPNPLPDLDPAKFSTFVNGDVSTRMFTMRGQNQPATPGMPDDGEWTGFSYVGNAGRAGFQDGILDCTQEKLNPDATQGVTLPGNADQYACWALQAVQGNTGGSCSGGGGGGGGGGGNPPPPLCYLRNGDGGCYPTATATDPGVQINVAWGIPSGSNGGSQYLDLKYVGEFQMLCFFSSTTDACTPLPGATPMTGYPIGTIVGYMKTIKSAIITPEDILTNTVSNVQRIVLVK
jgi:hypothetical protein